MGLRINQNIAATNAYRNLTVSDGQMAKSLEKLSSGFRINRAADDAAGLSISEGMRSQIGGLKVAVRNSQDGISLVQTTEGALTEVHSLLQRARDLSVQAANTGTTTQAARDAAKAEVDQIVQEVDRISQTTEFGGKKLLDGSQAAGFKFHVGSGASAQNQVTVNIGTMSAAGLGLSGVAAAATGAVGASIEATTAPTVAITYNSGVAGAADVSTTITVASNTRAGSGGDYDLTLQSDATAFLSSINTSLTAATGGNVEASFQAGATPGTSVLKLATSGTGTSSKVNVTGGTMIGAGAGLANIAAGANSGSGTGSIGALVAAGDTTAITTIDAAIGSVSTLRANLGAYQNRFEHTIANLSVAVENLSASESRIRDTDMAMEMTAYTRTQILTQAGTAMLAQANQSQQSVLSLLRG